MKIYELNENQHNFIDIVFKMIGGIFIIISTLIGIKQFSITNEREFLIILYEDDIKSLNELAEVTAKIATSSKKSKIFKEADERFDELQAGRIPLLGYSELDRMVKRFQTVKERYKGGSSSGTRQKLQRLSSKIAKCARLRIKKIVNLN